MKYSIQEKEDVTDDYKDLYEEMDGEISCCRAKKRKRKESPSLHSETTALVPPPEQDEESDNRSRSTQNDVMEALVHAKQELQRAQKLTTADRKQVIQTTRAKLKEAQLKFQALRQQQQQATTPALLYLNITSHYGLATVG